MYRIRTWSVDRMQSVSLLWAKVIIWSKQNIISKMVLWFRKALRDWTHLLSEGQLKLLRAHFSVLIKQFPVGSVKLYFKIEISSAYKLRKASNQSHSAWCGQGTQAWCWWTDPWQQNSSKSSREKQILGLTLSFLKPSCSCLAGTLMMKTTRRAVGGDIRAKRLTHRFSLNDIIRQCAYQASCSCEISG